MTISMTRDLDDSYQEGDQIFTQRGLKKGCAEERRPHEWTNVQRYDGNQRVDTSAAPHAAVSPLTRADSFGKSLAENSECLEQQGEVCMYAYACVRFL